MTIAVFAPAKVNLTLQVSAPIADGQAFAGYHHLHSLVVFADQAGDLLSFEAGDGLKLTIAGPFVAGLAGVDLEANLVMRAARALQDARGVAHGAHITLHKNLPIASGIGGGSSDAAACLRGLMQLWQLPDDQSQLHAIAARLGADVAVCLEPRSVVMTGIGTQFEPVDLPPLAALLVNPGVACPTPEVYRAFDQMLADGVVSAGAMTGAVPMDLPQVLAMIGPHGNSLEQAACQLLPEIGLTLDVLRASRGQLAVAMSGSGATCFAIYPSLAHAQAAAEGLSAMLADVLPGLWLAPTMLGASLKAS